MSGPLTGIGSQQFPLSQPYQPGKTDNTNVREQDNRKDTSAVAKTAYSNANNVQNTRDTRSQDSVSASRSDSTDSKNQRGTNVDITI